jgi:ElaB/YqjD/DUF883 family membrane-anchored ribosome-binding protein
MELYYKDLISKDASLEKLVDDMAMLVQGANDFAEAAGVAVPGHHKAELSGRLERLKAGCRKVKEQARASALATDKLMRQYPYSSMGISFAVGIFLGALLKRR